MTKHENAPAVIADDTGAITSMDKEILREAEVADRKEHTMSMGEAWKANKKAILWSMALSAALIMEGYDVVVIGSYYGHPPFLKRFGVPANTEAGYVIPPQWQSALSNGSSAGGIIGLLINGWASDRFGPRIVMLVSIVFLTAFIFLFVFANSLGMLVAAEVMCGLPWGVFQTLTTAYASEVCPIKLRGYLTAWVNGCWGIGILLSSGVVKACLPIEGDWSWRMPFVLQWVWVIPLFVLVYCAPQSPWWLVRQNRLDDARHALRRLTSAEYVSEEDLQNTIAMMVHTNEMERRIQEGTTFLECFKGIDRRRTEISMMVFAMQQLSGQGLVGQGVQFLQKAGISVSLSFSLNMVLNAMFLIGTFCSWVLISWFGRRTLYLYGMGLMCTVLFIIGGLGWIKSSDPKYGETTYAIGSLLIMLNFVYNCTLGPVCYTVIGEVSSTRLRQKSIVLSRIAYQIMNIIVGVLNPRMLTTWNWGPKSGIFWGVSAGLSTAYVFFRLPETRNRSYGELDLLFEHKIPAWRFHKTKVNQFAESVDEKFAPVHIEKVASKSDDDNVSNLA